MLTSIKSIARLYRLFRSHPLTRDRIPAAFMRFIRFQIATRLANSPIVYDWVGTSRLIVKNGMRGVTGEVYTGCLEFEDMMFCAHLLREDELFVDVGANVGTYSVLLAHERGCKVLALEPIATTVAQLEDNLRINDIESRVEIIRVGASSQRGSLAFTADLDALNRVAPEGHSKTLDVPVDCLDSIIRDRLPVCIKIDVEGHEQSVLAGASQALTKPTLLAVLLEVTIKDPAILNTMAKHGFEPMTYDPIARELNASTGLSPHNTLFIRKRDFVAERLKAAPALTVGSRQF